MKTLINSFLALLVATAISVVSYKFGESKVKYKIKKETVYVDREVRVPEIIEKEKIVYEDRIVYRERVVYKEKIKWKWRNREHCRIPDDKQHQVVYQVVEKRVEVNTCSNEQKIVNNYYNFKSEYGKQRIGISVKANLGYGVKGIGINTRNGTQYAEPEFGTIWGVSSDVSVPITNKWGLSIGAGYIENKTSYGSAGAVFYLD